LLSFEEVHSCKITDEASHERQKEVEKDSAPYFEEEFMEIKGAQHQPKTFAGPKNILEKALREGVLK
jgi:hypothetical protein